MSNAAERLRIAERAPIPTIQPLLQWLISGGWRYIYACARRLKAPREVQDDIAQETSLVMIQGGARYDPRYSPGSYASRVVRNKFCDHHRRTSRSCSLPLVPVKGKLIDPQSVEGLSALIAAEDRKALRMFLDGLDEVDREILELRYYDNFNWDAVAEKVNIPLTTVWTRCKALLKQARHCLNTENQ